MSVRHAVIAAIPGWRACSACAGDYEDPERTAPPTHHRTTANAAAGDAANDPSADEQDWASEATEDDQ